MRKKKLEKVVHVLEEARNILDKQGWCQGIAQNSRGEFCCIGAIDKAAERATPALEFEARRALREVLHTSIVRWNDAKCRTKKQVLAAFDRAIRQEART